MFKHIFKKELLEMLRDRRVVIGSFVMPAVVILMMFRLIGTIESSVSKQKTAPITMVDGGKSPLITKSLADNQIETVPSLEAGRQKLKEGKAKLVLEISSTPGVGTKVLALYDSAEPLSEVMLRSVQRTFDKQNEDLAISQLKDLNLDASLLKTIDFQPEDIADATAQKGAGVASMIPYLVILWAFYGGIASVSDMVAGEKERGTLETLLISPATRLDIALGKFLALFVICLLSPICGLIGVAIAGVTKSSSMIEGAVSLNPVAMASGILALIPLVLLFTALLIMVSAWAKNMRECQTYLSVASFIVLIPAILSNVIGLTDIGKSLWIKFVPVLSTSVALRGAILGRPDWTAVLGSVSVCLVLAALLSTFALRMFNREEILARV